ncbi:protein O-mannosyl-transferase TMTC1-like [Procambarus clarkii]|uniref:protein O-mannosyl-transferase TMTC1-like n=1 Tax=Procambarus clarkii TaxID=6728 RepID=UPI003742E711
MLVGVALSRAGRLRAPCLLLLLVAASCRTLQRNRDWESRETLFLAGLRTLPHNAKMHYNFANLQKDLGNADLAKLHYIYAIRLWPGHSSAHNNLGTLLNDTTEAENHFRMALKAHPHHAHAYYNLANLRQQQGHMVEAVTLLEESLRYDATNRDAVSTLAGLYSEAGRSTEAESLHLALLAARPSDPVVHNNYAAFLQKIGRREATLRHYEAALRLDPEHTVALVNTATLMLTLHNNNQAEMLYKRITSRAATADLHNTTTTTSHTTSLYVSTFLSPLGDDDDGGALYRALAVAWEAEIGESLGKLYLNTGRLEEAESTFTSVLTRHPHMLSSTVYLVS